ncbi:MAG: hypothetical protein KatS3mg057_1535 [Herpetosiphonaceae bacterium]|nr:MAG: hypothetical protein KatS3mg057_1535 [Herpetosiphonaceae bacterium]
MRQALIVILLISVLGYGCTPASTPTAIPTAMPLPTSTPAPTVTSSPGSDADSRRQASTPISVTPILDTARQVEMIIPTSGGTLSVTGADGTTFQLDIPDRALISDTLVRMIPVSRFDGMPFGSTPYAVQLEPEGLRFYDFITLTITPTQDIPVDQQIFFGYRGSGENLALALPVVDSREIKIQLLSFSGYGVTKGLLAEIDPVRTRLGGEAESRLQSELAEYLLNVRQAQLEGGVVGEFDIEVWLQQYEEQVLRPRIAAAGESCAAARLAIQTVLGLERQSQLFGGGSVVDEERLRALAETAAEVCLREEYELCRDEHIIHRMIPVWFTLNRQSQILGLTSADQQDPTLEKAVDYVRKCLTFELIFESEVNSSGLQGGSYSSSVKSTIKLQLDPTDFTIKGQAPLVNTTFEMSFPGCSVSNQRGGGTFEALKLEYIADQESLTDAVGYVRDLRLVYHPGNTSEHVTITCPDIGSYTLPGPYWTAGYVSTHQSELTERGFVLEGWEIFGDEYYAKNEWSRDYADGITKIAESGMFALYHRPE